MPNRTSAAKRLLTSAKRQLRNRMRKSRIKTSEKQFLTFLAEGNVPAAKEALKVCFSTLDKAAKGSSITKNKADRKKSRLSSKLAAAAK